MGGGGVIWIEGQNRILFFWGLESDQVFSGGLDPDPVKNLLSSLHFKNGKKELINFWNLASEPSDIIIFFRKKVDLLIQLAYKTKKRIASKACPEKRQNILFSAHQNRTILKYDEMTKEMMTCYFNGQQCCIQGRAKVHYPPPWALYGGGGGYAVLRNKCLY